MTTPIPMTPWSQWTVAVTGMNARPDNPGPGYAVARCLEEAPEFKGRVIGLGYDVLDAGLHHRGVSDNGYLLPYPSSGAAALWDRLSDILDQVRIDVIIPCLDSELLNFIAIKDNLAKRGVRLLMPDKAMLAARNKDRLPDLCAAIDIKTPRCERVTDPAFFDFGQDSDWHYPVVVKGVFYDAYVVHGPEEARMRFHQIAAQWGYPILVQPFVAGEEYNLTALGDGQGGMIGAVSMRKRAVTEKGKAWAGISTLDPQLQEASAKLIAALKWQGPLEIETLRDHDGAIHLIEINPRFPAWIYLSHGVGRNLPVALLQLLAGERDIALKPAEAGTLFIRYAQDLIVTLDALAGITMDGQSVPVPPYLASGLTSTSL
ncbi:MAG: ATP-grasp domain-containing protein [Alphaproteobacteria bacterium]